jgi:hypothetical protein
MTQSNPRTALPDAPRRRIPAKQRVLAKYPEAHAVHCTILGLRFYAIRVTYCGRNAFECDALTASKAWTRAARDIEAGKQPIKLWP